MGIVVITGGTAGVGRATAEHFARAGDDVAVLARSETGLQDTINSLEVHGIRTLGISVDVSNAEQMKQAVDRIETELGPVDIWINCAMSTVLAPFEEMTHDEYQRVTEVTYFGYVNGVREALRVMKPRNKGVIIQVGSALAYRSIPLQSAYCAAKAAIRGFTDSLRCELLHESSAIQLTIVQLPAMNTPQFNWARNRLGRPLRPVAPVYQPEVAAGAIFNAAHRKVREVWVGKTTIQSIIGNMFFPQLLDKMMTKKAWEGQQKMSATAEPGPGNLIEPANGLHKIRGRFSRESKKTAVLATTSLPGKILLTVAGVTLLALYRGYKRPR